MKKVIVVLMIYLVIPVAASAKQSWQKVSSSEVSSVRTMCFKDDAIYVGTTRAVFKSSGDYQIWMRILTVTGQMHWVNHIYCTDKEILVATQNGLYQSTNQGFTWDKIFRGQNEKEQNCLYVVRNNGKVFLATAAGLFISEDHKNWIEHKNVNLQKRIIQILIDNQSLRVIYALSENALLKSSDQGQTWRIIYEYPVLNEEATHYDETIKDYVSVLRGIAQNQNNPSELFLTTEQGILRSTDAGQAWKSFNSTALPDYINSLIITQGLIYATTNKGPFVLKNNRWEKINQGLIENNVKVIKPNDNTIFMGSADGVFKLLDEEPSAANPFTNYDFSHEPTVQQVQQAAIRYNDIDPAKFKNWRRRIHFRALMPEMSLDYDKSVYGTAGSSTYDGKGFVGPRDWGLSLSWDFAELIWNSKEEEVIDHIRYVTNLREDVLDEITRIYFERRRLQMELSRHQNSDGDTQLETDLKIKELTAHMDALTGGYFTRSLKKNN